MSNKEGVTFEGLVRSGVALDEILEAGGFIKPPHYHDLREIPIPAHHVRDTAIASPYVKGHKKFSIDYKHEVRSLYVEARLMPSDDAQHPLPSKYIHGIFDSGAQSVCVQKGLPAKYTWTKIGSADVAGATGTSKADIYKGSFELFFNEGCLQIHDAVVWECSLPGQTQILVGQPVIRLFDFKIAKGFNRIDLTL